MRLFIAIDLNFSMKEELMYLAGQIKAHSERCSVTSADNLHLTLAFIGESDEKERITAALDSVSFSAFELSLGSLGEFSRKGEKLIYGAMEKNDALMQLQKDIAAALNSAGISYDRKKFLPHITITRRTITNDDFSLRDIRTQRVSSPVNEFYLYSSDLSGKKPVYTKVAGFKCK